MKAYIAIKYHADAKNKPAIEKISAALEQNGFETVCVARDLEKWGTVHFTPEVLMQRSFAAIESSDIIVIDLSEKGVGLGIEVGFAYAKQIPIVTIAKKGSNISTTLQGISQGVYLYDEFEKLSNIFAQRLGVRGFRPSSVPPARGEV